MTNEEALNICRMALKCIASKNSQFVDEEMCKRIVEVYDIEVMIEACEKQIPKKPIKHIVKPDEDIKILNGKWGKGTTVYKCECGCWLRRGLKYCYECGQRIDYSEVEE